MHRHTEVGVQSESTPSAAYNSTAEAHATRNSSRENKSSVAAAAAAALWSAVPPPLIRHQRTWLRITQQQPLRQKKRRKVCALTWLVDDDHLCIPGWFWGDRPRQIWGVGFRSSSAISWHTLGYYGEPTRTVDTIIYDNDVRGFPLSQIVSQSEVWPRHNCWSHEGRGLHPKNTFQGLRLHSLVVRTWGSDPQCLGSSPSAIIFLKFLTSWFLKWLLRRFLCFHMLLWNDCSSLKNWLWSFWLDFDGEEPFGPSPTKFLSKIRLGDNPQVIGQTIKLIQRPFWMVRRARLQVPTFPVDNIVFLENILPLSYPTRLEAWKKGKICPV